MADTEYITRCYRKLQHRPTVCPGLHNGRLCLALQFRNGETCWLVLKQKSVRTCIPMHTTISMIVMEMKKGKENKCEVVGQGSFTLPNTHRLITVTCLWEGAVVSHSNADVMMLVARSCHLGMSPITSPYCTSQNKEEIKREKATWATWETEQKFHTILLILHRNYVLSFDTVCKYGYGKDQGWAQHVTVE